MPQMAPISWLTLFFMFFITFLMFNIMNYFSFFTPSPSHQNKTYSNMTMNWKW